MPFPTEQMVVDFERLMERPPFYFKTTPERQWEIDDMLGLLDVPSIPDDYLTDEMIARWNARFR